MVSHRRSCSRHNISAPRPKPGPEQCSIFRLRSLNTVFRATLRLIDLQAGHRRPAQPTPSSLSYPPGHIQDRVCKQVVHTWAGHLVRAEAVRWKRTIRWGPCQEVGAEFSVGVAFIWVVFHPTVHRRRGATVLGLPSKMVFMFCARVRALPRRYPELALALARLDQRAR